MSVLLLRIVKFFSVQKVLSTDCVLNQSPVQISEMKIIVFYWGQVQTI